MELEAGTRVTDRLSLVRPLGSGGMGAVWVAHHEALDIDVAVKFILPGAVTGAARDAAIARFRREARLAAKLDSPHVVRVLDHGVVDRAGDETPFIAMELLRGESVAERLSREGRLAPTDVVRIVRDVAEGLDQAHELGVVHRDIKPANLFLTKPKDVVKILDFGIARASDATGAGSSFALDASSKGSDATATGAIVGTPFYMSPEQLLESTPPDKSADVWALAVVAYELATGKRPFSGDTPAKTLMCITQSKFDRATRIAPLSTAVDAFFERAFSPERERRFASAGALADALRVALTLDPAPEAKPSAPSAAPPIVADASVATGEFVRSAGLDVEAPAAPPAPPPATVDASPRADAQVGAPRASGMSPRLMIAAGIVVVSAVAAVVYAGRRAPPAPPASIDDRAAASVFSAPSASVPALVPPTPDAAPSASASARVAVSAMYLPCEASARSRCDANAVAWCDGDGTPMGCCAPGLAAAGKDRCACPKGGTDKKELQESGCAAVQGDSMKSVTAHMRAQFDSIRGCYQEALARNPRMKGKLALHVTLDPDGRVARATFADASAPDPDFQACTLGVVRSIQFDPPVNGTLTFTYPLSFSSD